MTNSAINERMGKLEEKIDEGFSNTNAELSNIKERVTKIETTLKNIAWAVLTIIAIGSVVVAIIYH